MSKIKSPRKKKLMAYDRDHVNCHSNDHPHLFRKAWPKKEARIERAARRKARQAIKQEDGDEIAGGIRRKRVRKLGTVSVRQSLDYKRFKREKLAGRKARKRTSNASECT